MTQHQIEVEGLRIAYQWVGQGPPLVLLHGMGLDSREWRRQLDEMSDEFTVLATLVHLYLDIRKQTAEQLCVALKDRRAQGAERQVDWPPELTKALAVEVVVVVGPVHRCTVRNSPGHPGW